MRGVALEVMLRSVRRAAGRHGRLAGGLAIRVSGEGGGIAPLLV